MALRKASAYSKFEAKPFTRISKKKGKSYIKTVPHNKIVKFHHGAQKHFKENKHNYTVTMISEEKVLIRDCAIEAARQAITKVMDDKMLGQFYLAVKVFPHHFLRENKTAGGAGADRVSTGMTQSYGIVIGRAAIVGAGKSIFFVSCATDKGARIARDALEMIKAKVPCRTRIVFEKISKK